MHERGLSIYFCSRLIWYECLYLRFPAFLAFPFRISFQQFSAVFAELEKATLSFVMPVRLSFHTEQLGYQWADFHEILHIVFFENLPRKFKFYYNLTRITDTLHEDQYTFFIISR